MGKLSAIIIVIIFIFLLLGATFIIWKLNLNLKHREDRIKLLNSFTGWVIDLGKNFKSITSYALKMHWLPNQTK